MNCEFLAKTWNKTIDYSGYAFSESIPTQEWVQSNDEFVRFCQNVSLIASEGLNERKKVVDKSRLLFLSM